MLIENRSCDECQLACRYLVVLGHYGRYSAQFCDACLQRGREEIAAAMTDVIADLDAAAERRRR